MSDSSGLVIRGHQSDDWISLARLVMLPAVLHQSLEIPYEPEDSLRDRFGSVADDTHVLIAEAGLPGGRKRLVGAAWVQRKHRRQRHIGRVSLVLHPEFRSEDNEDALTAALIGLCDDWLGLGRLEAICFADDAAMQALLARHGFEREAVLRAYARRAGVLTPAELWARRLLTVPGATLPPLPTEFDSAIPGPDVEREAGEDGPLEVLVRGTEADDWEDIHDMLQGPNVVHFTNQLPYLSRDAVRDRIENPPANLYSLAAVVDDRVVGLLGLHVYAGRRAHAAGLGMMVHPAYQGQGVGSALVAAALNLADNWLNLSRVELEVHVDNPAGQALYRKHGFEIEGTLRWYAFRNGTFVDSYLMARLRPEGTP